MSPVCKEKRASSKNEFDIHMYLRHVFIAFMSLDGKDCLILRENAILLAQGACFQFGTKS